MFGLARLLGAFVLGVGPWWQGLVMSFGQRVLLFFDALACMLAYRWRWRLLAQQLEFIGISSLVVVMITGAFTGAVFAAQTHYQFATIGMDSAVGPVVSVAMCRELGPVLCALMVAGRVGAAMAAELATMKITEQIDALRALAVYPTEYLVVPRFIGIAISMPILTAVTISCGIGAGYFFFTTVIGEPGVYYWAQTTYWTVARDVYIGLIKGFLFGMIIVVVSCHKGLTSSHGAEGVGHATTQAVVESSIAVLIANFFFTLLLNQIL